METIRAENDDTNIHGLLRDLLVEARQAEAVALTVVAALRGLDMTETADPAIALDRCCATPLTQMIGRMEAAIRREGA